MRAHLELTPAEKRVIATLTEEERRTLAAQMVETLSEELEWVVAVEIANQAAASARALVARVEAAPPPVLAKHQRYHWPLAAGGSRR